MDFVDKSGKGISVIWNSIIKYDEDNKPIGVMIFGDDISQRKKMISLQKEVNLAKNLQLALTPKTENIEENNYEIIWIEKIECRYFIINIKNAKINLPESTLQQRFGQHL